MEGWTKYSGKENPGLTSLSLTIRYTLSGKSISGAASLPGTPEKVEILRNATRLFREKGKKAYFTFCGNCAMCRTFTPIFFFPILSFGEKIVVVFALFIAPHICAEFFSSRVWELPIQISLGPNGQSLKKTSPLLSFPQIGKEGKMLPIFAQWIFFSPSCQLWQMSRKIGRNGRFPLLSCTVGVAISGVGEEGVNCPNFFSSPCNLAFPWRKEEKYTKLLCAYYYSSFARNLCCRSHFPGAEKEKGKKIVGFRLVYINGNDIHEICATYLRFPENPKTTAGFEFESTPKIVCGFFSRRRSFPLPSKTAAGVYFFSFSPVIISGNGGWRYNKQLEEDPNKSSKMIYRKFGVARPALLKVSLSLFFSFPREKKQCKHATSCVSSLASKISREEETEIRQLFL